MNKIFQKTWWILTVKGVITLIFGLVALLSPISTILLTVSTFSILLVLSGVFLISNSLFKKTTLDQNWKLTEGFIDIIIGVIILAFPGITLSAFIALVAIWISFIGLLQIMNGYRLRSLFNHWWILAANGFLAIAFAALVFTQPVHGMVTLLILVGLQSIVFGSFLIISSVYLKRLIRDISIEIPNAKGEKANQELSYF